MIFTIVHIVAVLLAFAGATLVALRRPFAGHVIYVAANACWSAWAISVRDWITLTQFSVFWVVALVGCWAWRPGRNTK